MKKVLLALVTVVVLTGLSVGATNVSVKCYPDKFAYDACGGWSGMRDPINFACQMMASQTNAKTTYTWAVGYWVSTKTEPETWKAELAAKYGWGTKLAPKLGITYNRTWHAPYWVAGQCEGWTIVVDYKSTSLRSNLIMHELSHAMRYDSYHCTNTWCVLGSYVWQTHNLCSSCKQRINSQYQ